MIGSRSAERAAETARKLSELVPGRGDRGSAATSRPRSRARSSSSRSRSAPSRRTSTTCARRSSPASCWSTAPSRSPPRSAARRPARSASGRDRPPSRRRRWCRTGVTVVAALHTVSAPNLADVGVHLDEDVLLCGDRKADKAKVARLIEEIAGLRAVNAGSLEMARIVEQLTPMLISINARYKTHAGIRITGLPRPDQASTAGALRRERSTGCGRAAGRRHRRRQARRRASRT